MNARKPDETTETLRAAPGTYPEREIVLTRVFDAPRALVFEAYTDAKHLEKWWGPKGYSITNKSHDIRAGGRWTFTMFGPNGMIFSNRIDYVEITAPERLLYLHGSDIDNDPEQFQVMITFTDEGNGKTRVMQRTLFRTTAQLQKVVGFGAVELGKTTLEKLAEFLAARWGVMRG